MCTHYLLGVGPENPMHRQQDGPLRFGWLRFRMNAVLKFMVQRPKAGFATTCNLCAFQSIQRPRLPPLPSRAASIPADCAFRQSNASTSTFSPCDKKNYRPASGKQSIVTICIRPQFGDAKTTKRAASRTKARSLTVTPTEIFYKHICQLAAVRKPLHHHTPADLYQVSTPPRCDLSTPCGHQFISSLFLLESLCGSRHHNGSYETSNKGCGS